MSSNTRLFIGRLSHHTRQRDLEELFGKYGRIMNCTMKGTYAFVEFDDARDAEDAIRALDGYQLEGASIAVEFSHGGRYSGRDRGSSGRRSSSYGHNPSFSPPRNTDFRVIVEGLPYDCNWQDLKDHFRQVGDVCFADVIRDRGGKTRGIVEFKYYEDMKEACKTMDRTRIRSSTVYVTEDYKGDKRRRSRSKSPRRRSRSKSPKRSPSRSPRHRSRSRSQTPKARSPSRSPRRSPVSRSRSRSHSPPANNKPNKKSRSPMKSRSPSRSPKRPKRSKSPNKSPVRDNQRSVSRSPRRRSVSKSPRRARQSRSRSRSH
eukprot:TRINITY_DN1798_c0_g1_i1.p1 TRINITY_DN1798_c0_g1~~TRINITY_DN1798_c0_g1_i1.p1  ORF type:complete len:333 (-),score=42.23 TRINITY_DN1798_c0_g1_i1:50-1000(-)